MEGVPISDLCDELGLQPTVFYRWQKEFFENGAAAFQQRGREDISATHTGGSPWEYPRRGGRFASTSMPAADLLMARWPQRWDRADFEDIKRRLCGWRMIDMPPFLPFDVQKKTDSDDR